MQIIKVKTYEELSDRAAAIIARQIKEKPDCVLGLATGSTPIGTYKRLVNADFSCVKTFNLDEYCGLSPNDPQSYQYFMRENLFNHVNIDMKNTNFPSEKNFAKYDDQIKHAGGIDLQLLGIGSNGHIGFNEPDVVFHNKTRVVELAESTIQANKRFFENADQVPKTAISMGIGTIMSARKVLLIAAADKTNIIKELQADIVTPKLPASILHYHPDCTIIHVKE